MPFAIGENIGPYRVMEQLGQGGMATVYKAYHAALDRYVALKVLHPAFGEDPNFEARFQREARLVAKLDHPNIVPVYDYSEHDKRPFLVMKFIEGETLKARMASGPLGSEELANIIDAIGSALAYAHKMGILHRDIKPSNVLISTDGSIYLADFGLARIASMGESTLSGDMIMGTPQYISPEQAMGKKDLDEGTDIYSFGVMLYEMVVGQVPFNADTPFSIIHDHIYTPLPIPHNINPSVPEPVERVLLKALSKERADRYASVPDMVAAFKQAWQSAGVPMKGTTITMSPKAVPAQVKSASTSAKRVSEPTAQTIAAAPPKAAKRPFWMVAAGVVLLFICFGFAFFALRRGGLFLSLNGTGVDEPTLTAVVTNEVAPPVNATSTLPVAVDTPIVPSPLPAGPTPSPAVLEALRAVEQNPNAPRTNLQLALAYWDSDQFRLAYETLNKAANLAGGERGFYLDAASQFAEREAWIASAAMYVRIANIQPGVKMTPEVELLFREAVYQASANPDLPTYLSFDKIARVDEPLSLIAQGRYALINNNITVARENLNRVKRMKPDMPESALLEAEVLFKDGSKAEARQLLSGLVASLDTPEWVRALADDLLLNNP
jgi:tRNA A-37 threonylcarbamoyl transferase component Bud32/Flp pilus assembly protein TadD